MILDRFGEPVPEPPKERPALGFIPRTLPHREDFEVLSGVTPPKADLTFAPNNAPPQYRRGR